MPERIFIFEAVPEGHENNEHSFKCKECGLRRDRPTPAEREGGKCEFCIAEPFEKRRIKVYEDA